VVGFRAVRHLFVRGGGGRRRGTRRRREVLSARVGRIVHVFARLARLRIRVGLIGSFGLFFTLFTLFVRYVPMVAMSEVKGVLPEAHPHGLPPDAAPEKPLPGGSGAGGRAIPRGGEVPA
jgi:hypothetical protein